MRDSPDTAREWADILGPRYSPRRVWWRLRFIPAWGWLMITMRGRRSRELWIGDSHAMTLNQGMESGMFMRANGGLILRAGARLMYSLGQKGFPPSVLRVVDIIGRYGRPGTYVPFYIAGEIDVRTTLAARPNASMSWVDQYVDTCLELSARMGAPRSYFVAPPPPCELPNHPTWYPITGTIQERLREFDRLRDALRAATSARAGAEYLDLTDAICDERGQLRADLTVEGAHTNLAGVALVRKRMRELRLTEVC